MKKYLMMVISSYFCLLDLYSQGYYPIVNMDEIVVYDTLDSSIKTDFSLKSIEKGKNIYIPDVLKNESEVNLTRRSISSDNSDMLSIRGVGGNRILVNLNGRSINAAGVVGGYYLDWSTIPMDNIEKMELIKGGSDVKYGNNALGGVLNIITKKPSRDMRTGVFSSYGVGKGIDYLQNYRLSHSWKKGIFGYSISGSYLNSSNFLWNNDYKAKNISTSLYFDMPYEGNLYLGLVYTDTDRGYIRNNRKSLNPELSDFYVKINNDYPLSFGEMIAPGSGNQNIFKPGPGAYSNKRKTYLDLGYTQDIKGWANELRVYKNIENRNEKNYSSSFIKPGYSEGLLVLNRKVESDRSWGLNYSILKEFEKHKPEFGFEYRYLGFGDIIVYYYDKTYNNNLTYTGGPQSQESHTYSYYFKDDYYISDKLASNYGIRFDRYILNPLNGSNVKKLRDSSLSSSLSLNYSLFSDSKLIISVYNKYRTPQMPEAYWWSNGITQGNPSLKPENNRAFELSFKSKLRDNSEITISGFNYNIDNYIMFRLDIGTGQRAVYNIDNVKIQGVAVDYRANIYSNAKLYSNFTIYNSKKGYDPYDQRVIKGLDYMPPFQSNVGIEFTLLSNSVLSLNWKYVDNQKTVYSYFVGGSYRYKSAIVKAHNVVDMEYRVDIKKDFLKLSIFCNNLFNEKYEEKYGYPMPLRVAGLTLTAYI